MLRSVAVVAAVLLVAACGGGDADTSDAGTSDARTSDSVAEADAPTGTPVVIAQISTQTTANAAAATTAAEDALDAWVKWTNAHGGIDGHPVSVKFYDDKGDAAVARQMVQQAIDDGAIALVGNSSPTTEAQFQDIVDDAGIPVIGGIAYTAAWLGDPLYFAGGPAITTLVYGELYAGKTLGEASKLGMVICSGNAACDGAFPLFKAFAEQLELDVVAISQVAGAGTQPNYTAECLANKDAGAETLLLAGPPIATVRRDCLRQDFEPTYMVIDGVGVSPTIAKEERLDRVVFATSGFPTFQEFPETETFWSAMEEYHPEYLEPGPKNDQMVGLSEVPLAWTAGEQLKKAIENAGVEASATVTSVDLIRGLAMFKDETLGGIAPPLTYGDGTTANPQTPCFWLNAIADGEYVAPHGMKPGCMEPAPTAGP